MRQKFLFALRTFPWRHHLLCLAPLALLIAGLALAQGTGNDLARIYMDMRPRQPGMAAFMQAVSDWVNPCFYLLYAYFALRGLRTGDRKLVRLALAYCAAQVLISFLLVRMLKMAVGKPRPMSALQGEGYIPFTLKHSHHSFPSGHTTEITGATSTLAVRRKRLCFSLTMGLVIALVGYSRIYLTMHHLSDLAAGMVAGTLVSLTIHYLCCEKKHEQTA